MLVITVTHQNRAADDPPRSGVDHHDPGFSNRAGMTQPSHVPASMGTLLHTGNVGMTVVGRVGRAWAGFAKAAEARPMIRRK